MSNTPLPKHIDALRAADRGLQLSGYIKLARLERLTSGLFNPQGNVEVELVFGVDEERIRTLSGTAQVEVEMLCQRCLEPVAVPLKAELNLGMASSEEKADNLPKRYDPLVLVEPPLELHGVVEDELILCLPLIALHEDCEVQMNYHDPKADAAEEGKKPNPFSVLAQLKAKK